MTSLGIISLIGNILVSVVTCLVALWKFSNLFRNQIDAYDIKIKSYINDAVMTRIDDTNARLSDLNNTMQTIVTLLEKQTETFVTKDTCAAHTKRHADINELQMKVLENSEDIARLEGLVK